MSAMIETERDSGLVYMNVKQVADYLQLNEKKIYALVAENRIPATKITVCITVPAVRTSAGYISICKKLTGFLIIKLFFFY